MTQLQLIAQQARETLIARGTPCAPLAQTDALVRRQLAVWIPLLRFAPPTRVRQAECLVIPLKEEDDGERINGASAPGGRSGRRVG